ncbi:MAG: methyl-accepting chemotaxis protein [Desulfobacterales bacterium]|nr:methyl-accepting chemotaxis protein [Desulfobacterales bacterium]
MKKFLSKLLGLIPTKAVSENVRIKLMTWFFLLALVPLSIMGAIAYVGFKGNLMKSSEDKLKALESSRANAVDKYFSECYGTVHGLNEMVKTLRSKAYNQLSSIQQLKKRLIESYFNERLTDVQTLAKTPVVKEALAAFTQVKGDVGGSSWQEVEQRFGPALVEFSETHGYYDTYLVSTKGKIVYTVSQETDLGQNLITGDLKESPAGKAFQKGMESLTFQDFEPYEPAEGEAASFIAAPIESNGKTLGVAMVQVSVDQINFVMQERTGLGQSGESYLVGDDGLFRSDSVFFMESTVMNPGFVVDTKGTTEAMAGRRGQGITVNYRGEYVLSSWAPVKVHDTTWAMLGEVGVTEAFVPTEKGDDKDFFTRYKERYGFENLYLMNPDGFLFFSVIRGKDYRTNMVTGPYKKTNLGRLFKNVLDKKEPGMADYAKYAPLNDKIAAFIAVPILSEDNEVEVVVAAQLSVSRIDKIMTDTKGLGENTETYLLGVKDKLFRSETAYYKEKSAIINPDVEVDKEDIDEALKEGVVRTYKNYMGDSVLRALSVVTVSPANKVNPGGIKWAVVAEVDEGEINEPVTNLILRGLGLFIITLIIVAGVAWWISRTLTVQINHIMDLFGEIGMGNFEARTPVTSQDELGIMASSLNAMLDNTLSLIQSSEERDAMQASVMKLLTEISGLAEGNLASRAEVTEDFTGAIADSFNDMAEQLGRVVHNVKDVTIQISATSHEVRTSTESLAETSEMQAVQVSDAIAAINEMAASIQQVAENATQSAQVSEDSKTHANDGATAVRDTNSAMESIREHVQETARAIKRLGESSQEVGNIVQLIGDIADRTSILALNASIQAAMAGEAGRGFAVVAEEVQRLAERSTNATQQIDTLIKNIQGEINEAGTSMEESIQRVVEGSKLADNAYTKLQEIENITTHLGELIQSISMASRQQARASENIAKTMQEVGEVSSSTSAAGRQTAISMKNLAETSDQLNESVSVFKLKGDEEDEAEDDIASKTG